MKRRTHLEALALGLLGSSAMAQASRPAAGPARAPLRVGVMHNDPESWSGAQVLAQVYKQAGLAPSFVPMPAARGVLALIGGDVDADLMRIGHFGTLHPQLIRVPTPLYRLHAVVASLHTRNAAARSRDDLIHYTVGAVHGYYYVQELTEGHPSVTLTQSTEQLCRMLLAHRVDLALDTVVSLQYNLRRLGIRDAVLSPPLMTLELYHYLHPRHAALLGPLDDTLRAMSARGELARLARHYEAQAIAMKPAQFF